MIDDEQKTFVVKRLGEVAQLLSQSGERDKAIEVFRIRAKFELEWSAMEFSHLDTPPGEAIPLTDHTTSEAHRDALTTLFAPKRKP